MNEIDWITTDENLLRILTTKEKEVLEKQQCVSDFKKHKLEFEAQKNWDRFYNRNSDKFFKDRHWTKRDLKIILNDIDLSVSFFLL